MICPFLGMSGDSRTALAFPSAWNHCHHCSPAGSVALGHQKNCCLSGNYEACPAFLQSPNNPLPADLRNIKNSQPLNSNTFWKTALVLSVLLVVMFLLGGNLPIHDALVPIFLFPATSSSAMPSLTSLPVAQLSSSEPSSPLTFTPSPLPIPNSTLYSGSRITPIITRRPHGLEEWIGVNNIFIIYRVKQGWSFERLASYYNTTPVAIQAVNYKLTTPLFPGQLVIIPINQTDVSGLPQFEIYRVMEDIPVEELAIQLNVAPDQLRTYNGFGVKEQLMAKEWIIVPREPAETK